MAQPTQPNLITGYQSDPNNPNYGQQVQVPRGQYVPGISATAPAPKQYLPPAPMADPAAFKGIIDKVNEKMKSMNDTVKERQTLMNAFFGGKVDPNDLASASIPIQQLIQSGNTDAMQVAIRSMTDDIAGRTDTIDQGFQYLTTEYPQAYKIMQETAQQKFDNLMKAYDEGGSAAFANMPSDQKRQIEKAWGLPSGYFDNPSLKESQRMVKVNVTDPNTLMPTEMLYDPITKQLINPQSMISGGGNTDFRTDRNNNPTAMTTDVAKAAGLVLGKDYTQGDPFTTSTGQTLYTAKLLGDPVETTIKAIDKAGFMTASGQPRWSYINMPKKQWDSMSHDQKVKTVQGMYQQEGGSGSLFKPDYKQYGLLANVSDFNPGNALDKKAKQYLDFYIKNASIPTAYQLGMGRSTQSSAIFSQVQSRAQDLYFAATGSSLPDVNILKGNKGLVIANNKLLNNINIQEGTVKANFDLAIRAMQQNGVNVNSPIVNKYLNPVLQALGDPDVQTYITSNITLQNEAASLLAVKNAAGTTVYDKMLNAKLIDPSMSIDQQVEVVKRLQAEAQNASRIIQQQNADLYKQIDPLEQDPNNPNRQNTVNDNKYQQEYQQYAQQQKQKPQSANNVPNRSIAPNRSMATNRSMLR